MSTSKHCTECKCLSFKPFKDTLAARPSLNVCATYETFALFLTILPLRQSAADACILRVVS
jgi:hypothetical protein